MSSFTEVKWNVTFEGTILDWHIELFSLVIFNYFEHNTCMFITVKGTRDFKMLGALIPARYCFGKLQIVFEDRKSTRLNSSHVAISYAVFCLKKKKKFIITFAVSVKLCHVTSISQQAY